MSINKRPFMDLAEELSSSPCPFCGKYHKVEFKFEGDVVTYSPICSCNGFNELLKKRFNTLYNLEMKRRLLGWL